MSDQLNFGVQPVCLGTHYHTQMSRPRHDPLTSLLEMLDNVLGRARWEVGIRMTCCHIVMDKFGTDNDFLVCLSNTKITYDEFNECLGDVGVREPKLTRMEWSYVRGKMGRPRRLSSRFLSEERGKLHHYRERVRAVQNGAAPPNVDA